MNVTARRKDSSLPQDAENISLLLTADKVVHPEYLWKLDLEKTDGVLRDWHSLKCVM